MPTEACDELKAQCVTARWLLYDGFLEEGNVDNGPPTPPHRRYGAEASAARGRRLIVLCQISIDCEYWNADADAPRR